VQTNNFAEYTALIRALEVLSKQYKGESIEVYADSELMIKQLKGVYKVKNENIKPLYAQIQKLLPHFSSISFTHVRREFNSRADELANLALC
jgi:ribonuclease HI